MNKEKPEIQPGDGLRKLRTTRVFRVVNYELYARPNKGIMIAGALTFLSCIGYITYMRQNLENVKYYAAVGADGDVNFKKKTSKWAD